MCGITGILNRDGGIPSVSVLQKMTDMLVHRGPDGGGLFVDECVGLGHRRLAIIDLSPAGHQPMTTLDGRYTIIYNGEVYNYREVRTQLEARGYHFQSRTDSEVVLYAYAEWREKCLEKFNGMFAFAIWDKQEKNLFLARDRYGIKPLYYIQLGNVFLFGSEIKAMLAHPDFQVRLDNEALVEYLTFQNFFGERTLFKGVQLLAAGTYLTVSMGHAPVKQPVSYFDFSFEEPGMPSSEAEYLEELNHIFSRAVNRQLMSDVPVGAYLSGGMDSGSITAVASRALPQMKTFTVGFDLFSASGIELSFDEREKAEHMSYLFQTEHYEMVLKAGDMERAMEKLVWHLEEPRVGQSYPNYYAAKLAGKFGKVVLSGAGGDELFGGYPWRYYRAVVNDDFDHYIDQYYEFWQRLIPQQVMPDILAPLWDEVGHVNTRNIFKQVFGHHAQKLDRPEDYINHSLYFECKTFLHGLLTMEDKLSMAHSLETRVPFLDNDLVDFAMRLPVSMKLSNMADVVRINENESGKKTAKYFEKTQDGKRLLRKMMRTHVPESVTGAVKQGFSAPDAGWFKGESMEYVKRRLFDSSARIYEFMEPRAVQSLIQDHLEGRENRRLLIWSLLYLETWCQIFLKDTQKSVADNVPRFQVSTG